MVRNTEMARTLSALLACLPYLFFFFYIFFCVWRLLKPVLSLSRLTILLVSMYTLVLPASECWSALIYDTHSQSRKKKILSEAIYILSIFYVLLL